MRQVPFILASAGLLRRDEVLPYDTFFRKPVPFEALVAEIARLIAAREQASYWSDSETLFRHTVACTSQNAIARCNLGFALVEKGDLDQAIEQFDADHETTLAQFRRDVERARYNAQRAERRYRAVDPENRLVARGLEAEWENALL